MPCKHHDKFEMPTDPHEKARYESAMRHVEYAKEAGQSSEEIHELYKKIMNFDIEKDLDSLPDDEPHQRFRRAVVHAQAAAKAGKSSDEVHALYHKIMNGEADGSKCSAKKDK